MYVGGSGGNGGRMRRTVGLGVLVTALTLVGLARAAAPSNDAFPGAVITDASGTTSGTTAEATPETGEPALGGASVWYAWEAPSSATYGFCATPGTAWDSPDTTPTADLTFECRLDTGAWAPCTSPVLLAATGGGSHTGYVRATDANGNVEAFPDSDTRALHGRP